MKCSDLHYEISLYADGMLDESRAAGVAQHLDICPLCRQAYADIREIRAGLRQLGRPEMPRNVVTGLRSAVSQELKVTRNSLVPVSRPIREWLQMSVMPYSVGAVASVVLGLSFLSLMLSSGLRNGSHGSGDAGLMAAGAAPSTAVQRDYVRERIEFAAESPSINPQGALVALTRSFVRGDMKDDEVVVVADVFGNGLAQIAEVVEPSRDRSAVYELQKALETDPAYAPFVPATMENRPENMRVVLRFQSVNVSTRLPRNRRSL